MTIRTWLKSLRRRAALDEQDFQEEIRAHLALAEKDRLADGDDPASAHYSALKDFGNVTLMREEARAVWTPRWLESLGNLASDVRYAVRTLAKNPAFSLAVIGVLTIGVGLNATVFTMLKAMALSPIAGVDRSAKLSVIYGETSAGRAVRVSYPDYRYLRDHQTAFSGLIGTIPASLNLGRGRHARPIWGELVSGNFFEVLRVRAALGRTLQPSDEKAPGRDPVVVLSEGLWRRDFGANPDILGKTIEVNNVMLTVVGVTDAAFHGTTVVYDVEVFIPVTMGPQLGFNFGSRETTPSGILGDRRAAIFYPEGHLRPGTSRASAAAQIESLWSELSRERALTDTAQRARVVPFWKMPSGAPLIMLPTLSVLVAMGLLVLLIACANTAGLVLVRGLSRRGEIAMRLALGAARRRIIRLLMIENLVLALPGAFLGVLLAQRGIPVLVGYAERLAAPERIFFNVQVDSLVIAFAVLVASIAAFAFGLIPALQSSRIDLVSVINADASPRGATRGRLRTALVVGQVAVSVLLLVGAGLVTRSLEAARQAYPGFDPQNTTAIALDVRQNGYDERHGLVFYRKLLDGARADAGAESATIAAFTPLAFLDVRPTRVELSDYQPRRGEDLAFMSNSVGPDYFRTLRIPFLAGRDFEDRDDHTAAPVAIVNQTLAQRFWGGAPNAVGKRIRIGDARWRTIVGVAADVKYSRINEAPRPYVYLPFFQSYRPAMTVHTRLSAGAGMSVDQLVDRGRALVAAIDPDLPIRDARSLKEATRGALLFFELTATMLFVFGAAGMALAALGTYGLVSYTVKQSTHEIGIRMALGASGRSVVCGFLGRGLRLAATGAVLGTIAALIATRFLGSALFGVSATDAASFARALAVVLSGVMLATFIPAWRASRTTPLKALRHQ